MTCNRLAPVHRSPVTTMDLTLLRTPLYDVHVALGAKMVPFAGWEMPVQYPAGIMAEHKAVRARRRDLRRVAHGRVRGDRPRPERLRQPDHLQRRGRAGSRARCSTPRILTPRGHVRRRLHRLPVRRQADDRGQRRQHREGLGAHRRPEGRRQRPPQGHLRATSGCSRSRGPRAETTLQPLADLPLADIGYYHHDHRQGRRVPVLHLAAPATPARTASSSTAAGGTPEAIWEALLEAGPRAPIGLGARDSLRLEMGYAALRQRHRRHHHAARGRAGLDREARQGRAVHREPMRSGAQKARGVTRRLVGFKLLGRGIPRHGYPVWYRGHAGGHRAQRHAEPVARHRRSAPLTCRRLRRRSGTRFEIECRGERIPAEVVSRPFWTRTASVRKAK